MIDHSLSPGTRIAGYTIGQKLGQGAFGAVYRGVSPGGAAVALKVMHGQATQGHAAVEPEILAQLDHPNIVRIVDYFVHDGSLVLAMELVEGTTLEGYVRERGRLSPAEVRELLRQIGQALEHAHRRHVVHRDLKLANVLVDRTGPSPRFVLADFGVARIAEGIQLRRRVGGTYHFMAPEQLRGRATAQSDLWALGVVAYTALCGRRPFEGASLDELTRSVLYDTPVPPSRLAPSVPPEMDDLILRLLEKQLENRTPTATALLAKLGEAPAVRSPASPATAPQTTWESATRRSIRWSWLVALVAAVFGTLPSGVVGGLLQILAGATLLKAYRAPEAGAAKFVWPVLIGAMGGLLSLFEVAVLGETLRAHVGALWGIQVLFYLVFLPVTLYFVFKATRLQRELALVRTVRANAGAPDALLQALKRVMEDHPDDVTVHVRYIEALLAAGSPRDAVLEAKLVLEQDPFHIGAALLLAHAYFDLGLYLLCVQTCDAHLRVTPYAFELSDLRGRALASGGSA